MNIADMGQKSKTLLKKTPRDVLIMAILISTSSASFGLGYLAGRDSGQGSGALLESSTPLSGTPVVASKTGTKYYLPDCPGADKISEANKVWFASSEVARTQNYSPAENCPGLQ